MVDYNIASSKLFAKISNFSIEDRNESIHFPVYCQFTFPYKNPPPHIGDKPQNRPSQNNLNYLRWSDGQKENFLTHFRNNSNISKQDISQQINENIDAAIELLTTVYTSAANCMSKPSKLRSLPSQPPWWDITCTDLKQKKYSVLRSFRESNEISDIRKYNDQRNLFKHACWFKIQHHHKHCRQKLMESSKDPKKFWKTVKVSQTPPIPNISDIQWYDHFKSLLFFRKIKT